MKKAVAWFGILRIWSLTASTIPVLVGAALAARDSHFSGPLLALTLFSGWLLQIAANLLNTYGDFKSGVDSADKPPTAPQLVDGSLQAAAVFKAGVAVLCLGAGAGLAAAAVSDWRLLGFAVAGSAAAAFYTTGPRLKYLGLGLPMVATAMGVLMVLASYFAQARTITLGSVAASLPVTCLVGAILHGNDLRDCATDRVARITTVALIVGERNARLLFYVLHLAPYLIIAVSVVCRILPAWSLLCLLALPLSLAVITTCAVGFRAHDASRIAKLEGMSAGAHFIFGVLLVLGLLHF